MPARTPRTLSRAVQEYVGECARLTRSDAATDEMSFYPAINNLLKAIGAVADPRRTTIPNPAARENDFPDNAIYEEVSQVLVLPVEIKPADITKEAFLRLDQGRRYAQSFGGGHVLLTNTWQFVWAELTKNGDLIERDSVVD